MSDQSDKPQKKTNPWKELQAKFARDLPTGPAGLLRFRSRSQNPQSAYDAKNDPSANLGDSFDSATRRLLNESSQFSQFLMTLNQLTLGLNGKKISGKEWRNMVMGSFNASHPLPTKDTDPQQTGTEDRFSYKAFATILPEALGGVENAWNALFRSQADSSLPFNEQKIRTIEQNLFRNLSVPLPLNELGVSEKWHREAITNVEDFFKFTVALKEYSSLFASLFPMACTHFDEQDARSPNQRRHARDYYLDWLTACEYAYDQIAATPQFGKAYGNLINAFVVLRNNVNRFTEQVSGVMNLPTQKDLDQSHHTQHLLRKNHADMKEQLDDVQIQRKIDEAHEETRYQHLSTEIDQLKEQVLFLKQVIEKNSDAKEDKPKSPDDSPDRMH